MSEREQITEMSMVDVVCKFQSALKHRLAQKGYGTFKSTHEILGVLTEEFHELVDAVKSNDIESVRHELFDLAVGAVFGVACIDQNSIDW